jgi:hypothetical protein
MQAAQVASRKYLTAHPEVKAAGEKARAAHKPGNGNGAAARTAPTAPAAIAAG